jgi:hypothetical protein
MVDLMVVGLQSRCATFNRATPPTTWGHDIDVPDNNNNLHGAQVYEARESLPKIGMSAI